MNTLNLAGSTSSALVSDEPEIEQKTEHETLTLDVPMPTLGLMFHTETLDRGARPVILQAALYPFDMETEELIHDAVHQYLPMQPQLDLIPGRTISAETLFWWMKQSEEARAAFERNLSEDFDELPILMNQLIRRFNKLTQSGRVEYELIANGLFHVTAIETLMRDCGLAAPWQRERIVDLRTLKRYAGVGDASPPKDYIEHRADWDCKRGIQTYYDAKRRLRGG